MLSCLKSIFAEQVENKKSFVSWDEALARGSTHVAFFCKKATCGACNGANRKHLLKIVRYFTHRGSTKTGFCAVFQPLDSALCQPLVFVAVLLDVLRHRILFLWEILDLNQ